jgi:uroporphyrinogen decarboxylase
VVTSKQRVLAAVEHRTTDRCPITFDAQPEVYATLHKHFGTRTRRELFDKLNCDTWMILPIGYTYSPEQEKLDRRTTIWGYQTIATEYSGGKYQELCRSPLAGKDQLADIDNYPWPTLAALDFAPFATQTRENADRAIIGAVCWGSYFIATFIRGMDNLMMDLALNLPYARHLIEKITSIGVTWLDELLARHGEGVDIVYMADDTCAQRGPMFSPELFRELVVPYMKLYVDRVHKAGKRFLLHTCGSVRKFLPMIIESGVDMLEPIQIRAEGMDPAGLKRDFGKDICFYGGLDLQRVLCQGTPQTVADEVKRLIDILGDGGGYILGPGHTYIQPDAPLANILAMYETAASYHG